MKKIQTKTSLSLLLKLIAAIAFPIALQNLLTTTGSMVDTIMLARLGETTVGAAGLCAQFSSLLFSGYWGFAGGGMMFFAQYYGAGNKEGICKSYGITLFFMSITGVIFTCMALFQPEAVMALYTNNAEIQALGVQYLRIVGLSYPLQVLAMAQSCLLRTTDHVKLPLYAGIASVLTNFVCNYILIFGKFGFAPMGIRGAAVGTVLAGIVNVLFIVIAAKVTKIPFVLEITRHFRWTKDLVKEYLVKCAPIIANEALIGVGNMMINIVLGHQAAYAIAATAVFRTLEGIIISFFSGFSNASSILVGQRVGDGDHEEAWSRGIRLIYICSITIVLIAGVLILIHNPLLHTMGLSGQSYETATGMLLIYAAVCFLRMGNWAQNDTFRAAGDSAFGSILEITFMFAMVQPAIHLANDVFHWPFLVVFALCYCDEPVRYIIMQKHLYSGKWIKPVSVEGKKTIDAFRKKYQIVVKK